MHEMWTVDYNCNQCLSVCLSLCANMAEQIKVVLGEESPRDRRNVVFDFHHKFKQLSPSSSCYLLISLTAPAPLLMQNSTNTYLCPLTTQQTHCSCADWSVSRLLLGSLGQSVSATGSAKCSPRSPATWC